MPIQLGAAPEHGFDSPLGLLSDCHRRIERFLEQLLRVVEAQTATPKATLRQAVAVKDSGHSAMRCSLQREPPTAVACGASGWLAIRCRL